MKIAISFIDQDNMTSFKINPNFLALSARTRETREPRTRLQRPFSKATLTRQEEGPHVVQSAWPGSFKLDSMIAEAEFEALQSRGCGQEG